MTAVEFDAKSFQANDIVDIIFKSGAEKRLHLYQGHAFIPEDLPGIHHSQIRFISGDAIFDSINLGDVRSVELVDRVNI